MVDTLDLDYETRSCNNIKTVGLDVYVAPESETKVLLAAYSLNEGKIKQWRYTDGRFPKELEEALLDPHVEKWGFNSQFERVVTKELLKINTPIEGWRCCQVFAYQHSFMGGLDEIGEQIGLPEHLLKLRADRSAELIETFCMPQRDTQKRETEWKNHLTDPELWEEFCGYNVQDVRAEIGIKRRLQPFPVPDIEWNYYEMDQEINDRGMPVDFQFINRIIQMAPKRRKELIDQKDAITGLENSNSGAQLLPWLQARGYPWTNLRKETVAVTLKRADLWGLTPEAIQVLELHQWSSRTSTSKANKAKMVVRHDDNRARYLYQFCGAGRTGREAGRLIQPQNLTRTPGLMDVDDHGPERLEVVTEAVRAGEYEMLSLLVGEPMLALTGCMRGMFRAADDEELLSVDLASIESAGLGYLSRCTRLLNVFRTRRDPYKDFGTEFYRKLYDDITKAERQICKPPALGCFAADTLVLTNSGWKRIIDISKSDWIFDGVVYVPHKGILDQGVKDVINFHGVDVTPDHQILCGIDENGYDWCSAIDVLSTIDALRAAVGLAIDKLYNRCTLSTEPKAIAGEATFDAIYEMAINRTAWTWPSQKAKVRVYDIRDCGPRNRFMIYTEVGPVIAHNCGYRLSAGGTNEDGTKYGLIAYAEGMGIEMTQEQADRAVQIYRETYPEVVQFWYDLENAAYAALRTGQPQKVGYLQFECQKPFLKLRLPSGRYIYYYKPELVVVEEESRFKTKWIPSEGDLIHGAPIGTMVEVPATYTRTKLSYMGRNHKNSQWERIPSHGGLICENAVQAFTRDILFTALYKLHKRDYPLIGHAHDEGIALVKKGSNQFTLAEMIDVFKEPIGWAPGMPLGASGWQGRFYRK